MGPKDKDNVSAYHSSWLDPTATMDLHYPGFAATVEQFSDELGLRVALALADAEYDVEFA